MSNDKPYEPVFYWELTWADKPRDYTARPPQRKESTLLMYWDLGPNGGERWHWIVNDTKLIAQGYAETHLEAARKAEAAFFQFLEQLEN
ncbi:hypothetical protein [Pseudovibrio sp. WM33]|uniref:hypothetical protein n=1 Tax=Pseudovibrio sp. WM33 TaxID=1735585 RepID=UPI0007AEE02A|nr:hypothetical protein [Pseudovibrio sp. WM33]KZL27388.1 hypothetical protein PsWM33_00897 [Pseudovibrio sp. WM33]